ncbi:MAG: sigma-70 family RNA polymerase sigma factor [Spirochaetales bacterium]|nr:MAG: sigma-70 family RNA polymerase sigma factor [Spirochaetales bacterium]
MMDGTDIRGIMRRGNTAAGSTAGKDALCRGIWNCYYGKVSLFVKLNLGPCHTEDAVQEIFCRAFAALDMYNPDYAFDTWLFAIARNFCRDLRRKNSRGVPDHPLPADELDLGDPRYPPPENLFIERETERQIDRTFNALPAADRQIAFLRFHEHLHLRDISRIVEMPLGTVKYRIHEIRKAVRTALGEQDDFNW